MTSQAINFNPSNLYFERQGNFPIKRASKVIRFEDFGEITTFGRNLNCNVTLKSKRCNRNQCEVYFVDGKMYLKDLGGSAGTYVNHSKLRKESIQLQPGNLIGMAYKPFKNENLNNPRAYIYKVRQLETIDLNSNENCENQKSFEGNLNEFENQNSVALLMSGYFSNFSSEETIKIDDVEIVDIEAEDDDDEHMKSIETSEIYRILDEMNINLAIKEQREKFEKINVHDLLKMKSSVRRKNKSSQIGCQLESASSKSQEVETSELKIAESSMKFGDTTLRIDSCTTLSAPEFQTDNSDEEKLNSNPKVASTDTPDIKIEDLPRKTIVQATTSKIKPITLNMNIPNFKNIKTNQMESLIKRLNTKISSIGELKLKLAQSNVDSVKQITKNVSSDPSKSDSSLKITDSIVKTADNLKMAISNLTPAESNQKIIQSSPKIPLTNLKIGNVQIKIDASKFKLMPMPKIDPTLPVIKKEEPEESSVIQIRNLNVNQQNKSATDSNMEVEAANLQTVKPNFLSNVKITTIPAGRLNLANLTLKKIVKTPIGAVAIKKEVVEDEEMSTEALKDDHQNLITATSPAQNTYQIQPDFEIKNEEEEIIMDVHPMEIEDNESSSLLDLMPSPTHHDAEKSSNSFKIVRRETCFSIQSLSSGTQQSRVQKWKESLKMQKTSQGELNQSEKVEEAPWTLDKIKKYVITHKPKNDSNVKLTPYRAPITFTRDVPLHLRQSIFNKSPDASNTQLVENTVVGSNKKARRKMTRNEKEIARMKRELRRDAKLFRESQMERS